MKQAIIMGLCCVVISSCGSLSSRPYTKKIHGLELYSTKADLQTLFSKVGGDESKICASRFADVADTKSSGISLGASAGKYGKESIGDTSTSGAIDLGGRSSSLLIIRELAYRACELSANFDLTKEEALTLYSSVLEASKEIAQSNQSDGIQAFAAGTQESVIGADKSVSPVSESE